LENESLALSVFIQNVMTVTQVIIPVAYIMISLLSRDVLLTINKLYFNQSWDFSAKLTIWIGISRDFSTFPVVFLIKKLRKKKQT